MGLKVVPSPNVGGVKVALEDLKVCLVKCAMEVLCVVVLRVLCVKSWCYHHSCMNVRTYVVLGCQCTCLCAYICVCCMHSVVVYSMCIFTCFGYGCEYGCVSLLCMVCDNITLSYCFYETKRKRNDLFRCTKHPIRLNETDGGSKTIKTITKRFVAE